MTAIDEFPSKTSGVSGPYVHAEAITPHDTNELTRVTRGIWIGVSGNVKVTTVKGDTVTFTGAVTRSIIPVRAKIVFSIGTTATTMLGLS